MYTVVSELASRKHNPEGGRWFSIALGLSMLALWPVASYLRDTVGDRRWPILALRAGILFGVAVGIERLTFVRFSSFVNNGHEALAVGTFAGLYTGLLGLYWQRLRLGWTGALIVAAPLAAIFITQIVIYFDQRDLGWVDRRWRDHGRFAVAELRVLAVARRRPPVGRPRAPAVVEPLAHRWPSSSNHFGAGCSGGGHGSGTRFDTAGID